MRKIYIIGTIHGGYTPHLELEEVLRNIQPDQALVELSHKPNEDTAEKDSFRSEMLFAYNWAEENGIKVEIFDVDDDHVYFNEGYGPKSSEYRKLHKEQEEIIKKYTWKQFNRKEFNELLDHPLLEIIFSKEQEEIREAKMIQNIKRKMISEGRVVIISGAGHLKYFADSLPNTFVPLNS